MWLTFEKINSNILIDCRNLNNNQEIMPTYRLAKKLKIIEGLAFHIDKVFFGFYFLKGLEGFKSNENVTIFTDDKILYLSNEKVKDNSIEILDIVLNKKSQNFIDSINWIGNDFNSIKKGMGIIKFKEGYIVVKK